MSKVEECELISPNFLEADSSERSLNLQKTAWCHIPEG